MRDTTFEKVEPDTLTLTGSYSYSVKCWFCFFECRASHEVAEIRGLLGSSLSRRIISETNRSFLAEGNECRHHRLE